MESKSIVRIGYGQTLNQGQLNSFFIYKEDAMKLPETIAKSIFKHFCHLYKKRDLAGILDLFSQKSNLWGTAIDEYRVGLKEIEEQLKRDWSQSEAGELQIISWVNSSQNDFWAAAICHAKLMIEGNEYQFEHLRATITVLQENGKWKITHMHASFPDLRNGENQSFPV
jgi:hypothetical protein